MTEQQSTQNMDLQTAHDTPCRALGQIYANVNKGQAYPPQYMKSVTTRTTVAASSER